MPMLIECDQCGKKYKVPDDKAGSRMRCNRCKSVVLVSASASSGMSSTAKLLISVGIAVAVTFGILFALIATNKDEVQNDKGKLVTENSGNKTPGEAKSSTRKGEKSNVKVPKKRKPIESSEWREIVNKEAGLRVLMPVGDPVVTKSTVLGVRSITLIVGEQGRLQCLVSVHEKENSYARDNSYAKSMLGILLKGTGRPTEQVKDILLQDYRGREVIVIRNDGGRLTRGYVAGNRFYYLEAWWSNNGRFKRKDAERFANSFRITFKPPNPKPSGIKWLAATDLRVSPGVSSFVGTDGAVLKRHYVCLCAVFPINRQREVWARLPKGELAWRFGGLPTIRDMRIERQQFPGKTKARNPTQWKHVDPKSLVKFLKSVVWERNRPVEELTGYAFGLVAPLPKRTIGTWGNEAGHPKLSENIIAFKNVSGWREIVGRLRKRGNVVFPIELRQTRRFVLIRFLDCVVKPGNSYRYRVQLVFTGRETATTPVSAASSWAYVMPMKP